MSRFRLAELLWSLTLGAFVGCGETPSVGGSPPLPPLPPPLQAQESSPARPSGETSGRKCELDGPLACPGAGQICDMYRNECVDERQGESACDGVDCPPGTVCVPGVGRCGVPAGDGCFDMGTMWWTGRDLPPDGRQPLESPLPVLFSIENQSDAPLYIVTMLGRTVRFDLLQNDRGEMRTLDLAENHFYPTLCPAAGPAREIDAGRPPDILQGIPSGQRVSVEWAGSEQVGMRRICDGRSPGQFCYVDRTTVPGTYSVEVCAYSGFSGGSPDPKDANRLIGARPAGERQCLRVEFEYPTVEPVRLSFGR